MNNIIIDPEFRDLIPPLAQEELEQLHNSLSGAGCLSPLIVWRKENILIDGHNRYAWLTEHDRPFEVKEMSFSSREVAKRFIILNQLGRRNVTPETASMLRAQYHESMNKGKGGDHGQRKAAKDGENPKRNNCALDSDEEKTSEVVAKKTGVSPRTVENDVRLMKALDKLGISRSDYAAGKVLDENGKKRSKKSILDEAFPPKPKKTKAEPAPENAQPQLDEDRSIMDLIVIEDEEPQTIEIQLPPEQDPWTIALQQIPKLTKDQRQKLFSILHSKWDCRLAQS